MQTTIEVGPEIPVRRIRRGRQRPHHDQAPGRQPLDPGPHQVPQPALDPVPGHGGADRPGHDEADPARRFIARSTCRFVDIWIHQVDDHEAATGTTPSPYRLLEVSGGAQAMSGRQHRVATASDREALAALATPTGQDRAAGAGAHPQAESVHLVAPAVVRLVRTLAHELISRDLAFGTVEDRVARRKAPPEELPNLLAPPAHAAGTRGHQEQHLEGAPGRGHAAPVEPVSTCQRYAAAPSRVNSTPCRRRHQPNRRSSQVPVGVSGRHAAQTPKPVENRLPGRSAVVSVPAPDAPEQGRRGPIRDAGTLAHPVDKGVDRHKWTNQT